MIMDVNIKKLNMFENQWLLKLILKFVQQKIMILCKKKINKFHVVFFFSIFCFFFLSRQFFALDEDQRENLRRERRRLQEQLRRVRRQDRLQQRNTTLSTNTNIDQHNHSPSSHSTNPSPIRNLHLHLNNSDLSSLKLPIDSDLLLKSNGNTIDDNHSDLFMDNNNNNHQLISTSMDNINNNNNSQLGFMNYLNSTSFNDDGQDNNEMISPTTSSMNNTDSTLKRKKKSEKDLKWVKEKIFFNIKISFMIFFLLSLNVVHVVPKVICELIEFVQCMEKHQMEIFKQI